MQLARFYISDSETRFFFEALIRITHRIRPKVHEKVSGPVTVKTGSFDHPAPELDLLGKTQNTRVFTWPT